MIPGLDPTVDYAFKKVFGSEGNTPVLLNLLEAVLKPPHHLDFQLRNSRHPELVFSTLQSMHVLELPKFRRSAEELVDPVDVWCYFLVHGAELDTDNLPDALRTKPVQRAMEVLQMLTQNDLERERYQARLKAERDHISFLNEARNEALSQGRSEGLSQGLEKGLAQGLEKGHEEGELVGRIHVYQELLKLPLTSREELLAQPLDYLKEMANELGRRVGVG